MIHTNVIKAVVVLLVLIVLQACSAPPLPNNPLVGIKKGLWVPVDPMFTYTDSCEYKQKPPSLAITDDSTTLVSYAGFSSDRKVQQTEDGTWGMSYLDSRCARFIEFSIATNTTKDTLYMTFEKKDGSIMRFEYINILSSSASSMASLREFEASLQQTSWKESINGQVQRFIRIYGRTQRNKDWCFDPPKTDTINDCQYYDIDYLYENVPRKEMFGFPMATMELEYLSGFYRISAKVTGDIRHTRPDDRGHIVKAYDIEQGKLSMISLYNQEEVIWERVEVIPHLDSLWSGYEALIIKSNKRAQRYKAFDEIIKSYISEEEIKQGYRIDNYDLDKGVIKIVKLIEPNKGGTIWRKIEKTPYLDSLRYLLEI